MAVVAATLAYRSTLASHCVLLRSHSSFLGRERPDLSAPREKAVLSGMPQGSELFHEAQEARGDSVDILLFTPQDPVFLPNGEVTPTILTRSAEKARRVIVHSRCSPPLTTPMPSATDEVAPVNGSAEVFTPLQFLSPPATAGEAMSRQRYRRTGELIRGNGNYGITG